MTKPVDVAVKALHDAGLAWDGDGYPDRWAVDVVAVVLEALKAARIELIQLPAPDPHDSECESRREVHHFGGQTYCANCGAAVSVEER